MTTAAPGDGDLTIALRSTRDALVAEDRAATLAAHVEFGVALSARLDATLSELLRRTGANNVAVVALGSYSRREIAPGSDVDVLLVLPQPARFAKRSDPQELAERLWYPLWDAGFVTGHGARTIKESLALADDDVDAATALLDIRYVAGDRELAVQLAQRAREHLYQRRDGFFANLSNNSEARRHKPGLIAEMLEPNLKDGGGGIRDIQSLQWVGRVLHTAASPGVAHVVDGLDSLVDTGLISSDDAVAVRSANDLFVAIRMALHRVNGGRSDLLALQDQDAVSGLVGSVDADALVRSLAHSSRLVAWLAQEVWVSLRETTTAVRSQVPDGLVCESGRLRFAAEANRRTAAEVLQLAVVAAEQQLRIHRDTLRSIADCDVPVWDAVNLDLFVRLLRSGARLIEVVESLEQVDAVARILPEWSHVRSLPQRNAYHRHTVDRHLLETVVQCAALLDGGARRGDGLPLENVVARACRRPELLLLAALLHDIGKGLPEDHATIGARMANDIGRRIGLDSEGVEILVWLVRDHLLMADTATRRDLSDPDTIDRFCAALAGDGERLRLLYLLTIGDSIATGPAAWSKSKALLLRDLFVRAAATVESDSTVAIVAERERELGERVGPAVASALFTSMPPSYPLAFDLDVMCTHVDLLRHRELAVGCDRGQGSEVVITIAAPDRTGLLSLVAGALTCCSLTVREAALFTTVDGMALDVFTADDTFGRFDDGGELRVRSTIARAIAGELDVAAGVEERRKHYSRAIPMTDAIRPSVDVVVDQCASSSATVIEVHAKDQVGLLFRLAHAISDANVDVSVAKVATLGDRVVDVFYVSKDGAKLADGSDLDALCELIRRAAFGVEIDDRLAS